MKTYFTVVFLVQSKSSISLNPEEGTFINIPNVDTSTDEGMADLKDLIQEILDSEGETDSEVVEIIAVIEQDEYDTGYL